MYKKNRGKCLQKYVREEILDKQVSEVLDRISIDDEIKQLMLESLEETNTIEYETHLQSLKFWQREYNKHEEQKSNLIKLFTKSKITESQFDKQNAELLLEQEIAEENLQNCKNAGNKWLEQSKGFIIVANQAFWTFKHGSSEDKKTLLSIIGSNFILTDKKLVWDWNKPFDILDVPNKRTIWSGRRGSNSQPSPWKGDILSN